jgi:copper resistance protein D
MMHWLAFIRSIHIAGSILLAAVFAFRLIVLESAASAYGRVDRWQPGFRDAWNRFALANWIVVICSGLVWFTLAAASIGGAANLDEIHAETLGIILFQTQFGHLWLIRSSCCLVLGVLLFTGCHESIKAFISLAILISLAVAGHAGARASSAGGLALAGDIGHLIATALWPGGLMPLLFVLCRESRAAADGDPRFIAEITRRFSAQSLFAVALLAATGILNTYFIVGSPQALFVSHYGHLLLVKITLFLLMICFGALNLFVVKPALIRLATVEEQGTKPSSNFVQSLIRNVVCEILLAAGVVLVVGFLGVTPPPMH